jgi:hypothetical protein
VDSRGVHLEFERFTGFDDFNRLMPTRGLCCSIQLINKHFLRSLITYRHQHVRQTSDNLTSSAACRTPTILFSLWHSSHGKLLISPMSVRCRRGSECGGGSSEVASGVAWFRHGTLIKQLMVFRGALPESASPVIRFAARMSTTQTLE